MKAENLFGEIEPGAGKPVRARHPVLVQHLRVGRRTLQVEVLPDRFPEVFDLGDRPFPTGFSVASQSR